MKRQQHKNNETSAIATGESQDYAVQCLSLHSSTSFSLDFSLDKKQTSTELEIKGFNPKNICNTQQTLSFLLQIPCQHFLTLAKRNSFERH